MAFVGHIVVWCMGWEKSIKSIPQQQCGFENYVLDDSVATYCHQVLAFRTTSLTKNCIWNRIFLSRDRPWSLMMIMLMYLLQIHFHHNCCEIPSQHYYFVLIHTTPWQRTNKGRQRINYVICKKLQPLWQSETYPEQPGCMKRLYCQHSQDITLLLWHSWIMLYQPQSKS